jgi:hypothetical protein
MTACPGCGAPVVRRPGPGRPPKRCSAACRVAAAKAAYAARQRAEQVATYEAVASGDVEFWWCTPEQAQTVLAMLQGDLHRVGRIFERYAHRNGVLEAPRRIARRAACASGCVAHDDAFTVPATDDLICRTGSGLGRRVARRAAAVTTPAGPRHDFTRCCVRAVPRSCGQTVRLFADVP